MNVKYFFHAEFNSRFIMPICICEVLQAAFNINKIDFERAYKVVEGAGEALVRLTPFYFRLEVTIVMRFINQMSNYPCI